MSTSPRVLVSHSGRQHVNQLLIGLEQAGLLERFYTSMAPAGNRFPYNLAGAVPGSAGARLYRQLKRRRFLDVDPARIRDFPWTEVARLMLRPVLSRSLNERVAFLHNRLFDRWVARNVGREHADVMVGYEECSARTFRAARAAGMTTVLDLAQIHYRKIEAIAREFPVFGELFRDVTLRRRVDAIKQEELDHTDHLFCLSSFARDSMVENGFDPSRITLTYLGFDPGRFRPKQHYRMDGPLEVIFVGTVSRRKGIDVLIRAVDRLRDDGVRLTLVGPLADAKDLIAPHRERFRVVPGVAQTELNDYFAQADLFVFPSYLDSWGMVVLEAMACGLPVVVTENTGSRDAVTDACGHVIAPGDAAALAERIEWFRDRREETERMGRAARQVAEDFTWSRYHRQIGNVARELATRP